MDERLRLAVGAGVAELPHAYGPPQVRGLIRQESRDFCVSEKLSFDLEGEGEHVYLLVRKTGGRPTGLAIFAVAGGLSAALNSYFRGPRFSGSPRSPA